MPANMKKLIQEKDLIMSTLQTRGPSLPVHVARATNLSLLFASAYLSELYGERKIVISNMRVGSSPLYYVPGDVAKLENFVEYLNPKEKEALALLKEEKVLDDEAIPPAIRVALRELKDFAVPLRVKNQDESKLIWKYFTCSDEDVKQLINPTKHPLVVPKQEAPVIPVQPQVEVQVPEVTLPVHKEPAKQIKHEPVQEIEETPLPKAAPLAKKKVKTDDLAFSQKMKDYLLAKDIEVLDIVNEKKKDWTAKIRIDMPLGKQEFYLVIKDKKKVTSDDLTVTLHKAQLEKMPAYILSPGTLDKEASEYLKHWRNLIKFDKLKI